MVRQGEFLYSWFVVTYLAVSTLMPAEPYSQWANRKGNAKETLFGEGRCVVRARGKVIRWYGSGPARG